MPAPQPNVIGQIFANGLWYNRFYQFGTWHGPFQHSIFFNPYNNTITGAGVDNIGEFTVYGQYSTNTLQIMLGQKYRVRNLVVLINKFDIFPFL